jgi:ATP-binding cassette subfamily B (MDR/TAP) protein 1
MLGQTLAFAPNYNAAKMAAGRLFYLMDRKPRIPSSDENANELVSIYGLKLHIINCV